jgi:hypothetical protein
MRLISALLVKRIMHSTLVFCAFSVCLVSTTQAQDCDRACLESYIDQLMSAYEARDASVLPMADNYRYTENGQEMAMDDGLWQNFVSHNTYELTVSDPVAGQVVFLTVVTENEDDVIAHFRLKIEDRRIVEIEALLARNNNFAVLENLQTPRPIFLRTESIETRSGRRELMAAADAYFTGLDTENSGANVPFHEDCRRQENGMILANSPDPEAGDMQKLGCKAQFDTGFSTIVTDVRERRYMVLDEERGLSYAIVFFDHNGTPKTMGGVGGVTREVPPTYQRPSTIMIGELFKIVDGNIRQIEAIIVSVPYGMPSGWNGEDLVSMGQL